MLAVHISQCSLIFWVNGNLTIPYEIGGTATDDQEARRFVIWIGSNYTELLEKEGDLGEGCQPRNGGP